MLNARGKILARAHRSARVRGRYVLGKGGRDPLAASPYDDDGRADCSAFVAHCLGWDRYQPRLNFYAAHGGWISTRSMEADARAHGPGILEMIPEADALPGDVIVYGTKWIRVGARKRKRIGHCGIVSRVAGGKVTHVIHCSGSNDEDYGTAIAETPLARFWRTKGAIIARYRDDEPDADPEV